MKTNFNNSWRKTVFFAFLILSSVTLYNCSNDDDNPGPDPITQEEVDEAFEGVEEIPDLEDEDPEVEEPDTSAETEEPAATTAAADNVTAATSEDDLTPETQQVLDDVEAASASLPASFTTAAANLTPEAISNILDIDADIDDELEADDIITSLPENVRNLLPRITFNFSAGSGASSGVLQDGVSSLNVGVQLDPIAQTVDAPCEDLYNDTYDEKIAELQEVRDAQLATITANYDRRMTEAGTRYDTRLSALQATRAERVAELSETANDFLAAAAVLDLSEDQLKALALLYALEGRRQIRTWYNTAVAVLQESRETEEATAASLRDQRTATVTANYQTSANQALQVRNEGLADCHNQGSGS